MPLPRPTLSSGEIDAVVRAAFEPGDAGLAGVEVEWPVHRVHDSTLRPSAEQIALLANTVLSAGSRVTFEPGGQVELSTAPHRSVGGALRALRRDELTLRKTLRTEGLEMSTLAVDQRRRPERVLELPRYRAMEVFFDQRGPAGRWMMCNTASTQVNLSHDALNPHRSWYAMNAIAPILVAMFANSPGRDARGVRWASLRQGIWGAVDPSRTRPVRTDLPPEQAWREYAVAADVLYIPGDQSPLAPRRPVSFAQWMSTGLPCGWPTVDDFRYHLTTLFPPVRPRGWLELRVLDLLPDKLRETAVLTAAAACTPAAAAELRRRLPFVGHLATNAARIGLQHPTLLASAQVVAAVARDHVHTVSHDPEHVRLLDAMQASLRQATRPVRSRSAAYAPDLGVDVRSCAPLGP